MTNAKSVVEALCRWSDNCPHLRHWPHQSFADLITLLRDRAMFMQFKCSNMNSCSSGSSFWPSSASEASLQMNNWHQLVPQTYCVGSLRKGNCNRASYSCPNCLKMITRIVLRYPIGRGQEKLYSVMNSAILNQTEALTTKPELLSSYLYTYI